MTQRTNTMFTKIINCKRQIVIYLTGKLPVTSNRGNKYLFVLYNYDSNIILVRLMKSSTDREFIRFFKYLHEPLLTRGLKPTHMIPDN